MSNITTFQCFKLRSIQKVSGANSMWLLLLLITHLVYCFNLIKYSIIFITLFFRNNVTLNRRWVICQCWPYTKDNYSMKQKSRVDGTHGWAKIKANRWAGDGGMNNSCFVLHFKCHLSRLNYWRKIWNPMRIQSSWSGVQFLCIIYIILTA